MNFVKNELIERILVSIKPGFVAARGSVVVKLSQMGSTVELIVKKYDLIISDAINGMNMAFGETV
jgi:hypothetical protein